MSMPGKLFERGALDLDNAESGFAAADRRAIIDDLATADEVEAGLGAAIARFVVTGEGADVLLRIDAILQSGAERAALLDHCLDVPTFNGYRYKVAEKVFEERRTRRRRILLQLEGFDAACMCRLGLVMDRSSTSIWGYGTDRSPGWLRRLHHAIAAYRGRGDKDPVGPLTAARQRDMLGLDGSPAAILVDVYFGGPRYSPHLELPADLPEVLEREVDGVCDEMLHLEAGPRGAFLNYLAEVGLLDRVPVFFERVFAAAGANAKATREPALGALLKSRERAERRALVALASASADERMAGVQVLGALPDGAGLDRLEAHRGTELSKQIVQAIEALRPRLALARENTARIEADGADGYMAIDGSFVPAPPRRDTPDTIPADTAEVLERLMREANAASKPEYDDPSSLPDWLLAWHLKNRGPYRIPFDLRCIRQVTDAAMGFGEVDPAIVRLVTLPFDTFLPRTSRVFQSGLKALLARPDFGTRAVVRLFLTEEADPWGFPLVAALQGYQAFIPVKSELARRVRAGCDIREIFDILQERGFPIAGHAASLAERLVGRFAFSADPPNPTLWTIFAAPFDEVDAAIARASALRHADGHAIVLGLCALFPKPPRRYLGALLEAAAQGMPPRRRAARAYLAGMGDLTPVIVPLLNDLVPGKRAAAAAWLGDRKDAAAVPFLRAALKAEKALAAKAAILAALAACGDDISAEFAEDRLMAEAARELPKLKVDYSAFMASRPALRWADGRRVAPRLVEYWFARAHKLKQPGGDPMLAMVLARLDGVDAAAMGRDILATFIRLDTHKATSEEANAYAEAQADGRVALLQRWRKDYTRERAFAELRQNKLGEYLGSALDHRGLLALARRAPAGEAVAMVKRYMKDHGKRASQCRALLDMLAADPIPQKLQAILAAAQRHRQPGARKYARALADAIAEARGWTAVELADRTVPTLDFDAAGIATLEIGARPFRLRLADDLALALENPDGKTIAALPSPKDPAEAEAARAAKRHVSATRKELKQTVEAQTARLYEAMCVERRWAAADFRAYFLAHPILSRLVRRLVLAGHDADGRLAGSMRLLDDGTLSDHDDGPVALERFAEIGIAHRATLGEAAAAAWRTHLSDYDVTPLFAQFDRAPLAVADPEATAIDDRRGHAIDSSRLRTAAARRGYQPGAIMDATYGAYEKPFADLGLAASIGFSGGVVGDTTTRAAALHSLRFVRVRGGKPSNMGAEGIALAKVPPILRQETWADYHEIAAAGTGFDPNWEKLGPW